jgi:hypothetical protein
VVDATGKDRRVVKLEISVFVSTNIIRNVVNNKCIKSVASGHPGYTVIHTRLQSG